jgi:zinc protease
MKKISLIFFLVFSFNLQAMDPFISDLEKKELPDFDPPEVLVSNLENKIKFYYLQNESFPVFEMTVMLPLGRIHDSDDKQNLSDILVSGMVTGGTTSKSPEKVDQLIERNALSLDYDVNDEYSLISIKSLAKNQELALDLIFDILRNPLFDEKRIELIKKRKISGISRRNEKPMSIAVREWKQLLFGEKSIWARTFTEEDINNIDIDDLKALHKKIFNPAQIMIGVTTKDSEKEIVQKIEKRTEDWISQEVFHSDPKLVSSYIKPSVNIIHKPSNQSAIILGHFGGKRFDEDKFETILANFILGGSTFGARLGTRIRTTLGLAYSVYSSFGFGTDTSYFAILSSTKTSSTTQVIKEVTKIIDDLRKEHPITKEELEFSKKTLLGQLIFEYDNLHQIVVKNMYYDYFGYPPNYLKIYQREIKEVTLEEVNQAVKNNFKPDKFIILVVGDKNKINLSEIGKVRELPLDNN